MRIAQIAPLYEMVPPATYGGTERVIANLCDGLVGLGHDVVLFAAGSSETAAHLESVVPAPLRTRMTRTELVEVAPHLHLRMLADIYARGEEFDVIHSHLDVWTLPFAEHASVPTLLTLHGRLDTDVVQSTLPLYPNAALVSISNEQRRPLLAHRLNWVGTVHNGLDLPLYGAEPRHADGYLAFMGRISPEKGPAVAVQIAQRTGRALRVAAKIDPLDFDYFRDEIEPLFSLDGVDFIGEVDEGQKPHFYAGASATLFPSDWPEPFGLVMIESMAAGTPVVALRRGSVPEILIDGVTGFICDDVDEMVDAVGRLDEIDPEACREQAKRFDSATMCEGYADLYRAIQTPTSALASASSDS